MSVIVTKTIPEAEALDEISGHISDKQWHLRRVAAELLGKQKDDECKAPPPPSRCV